MDAEYEGIVQKMNEIPPGPSHWREFQKISGDILGKLYAPHLGRPYEENTTFDGLDRRDWIFPNHATEGFWATMMRKYDADVVLVDAKNYSNPVRKGEVVQIRNYLHRGISLGKLGIILSRMPHSESASKEQQDAFHNNDLMILLICDQDISKMFWLRKAGLDPSYVLDKQRLEVQFRG